MRTVYSMEQNTATGINVHMTYVDDLYCDVGGYYWSAVSMTNKLAAMLRNEDQPKILTALETTEVDFIYPNNIYRGFTKLMYSLLGFIILADSRVYGIYGATEFSDTSASSVRAAQITPLLYRDRLAIMEMFDVCDWPNESAPHPDYRIIHHMIYDHSKNLQKLRSAIRNHNVLHMERPRGMRSSQVIAGCVVLRESGNVVDI